MCRWYHVQNFHTCHWYHVPSFHSCRWCHVPNFHMCRWCHVPSFRMCHWCHGQSCSGWSWMSCYHSLVLMLDERLHDIPRSGSIHLHRQSCLSHSCCWCFRRCIRPPSQPSEGWNHGRFCFPIQHQSESPCLLTSVNQLASNSNISLRIKSN